MNGRIYDALLGRFLSADLIVQNPANLQCFNRYSYVQNNPLSLIDPTGYESFLDRFMQPEFTTTLWSSSGGSSGHYARASAEVVRTNADGTISKIPASVTAKDGKLEIKAPQLKTGDRIVLTIRDVSSGAVIATAASEAKTVASRTVAIASAHPGASVSPTTPVVDTVQVSRYEGYVEMPEPIVVDWWYPGERADEGSSAVSETRATLPPITDEERLAYQTAQHAQDAALAEKRADAWAYARSRQDACLASVPIFESVAWAATPIPGGSAVEVAEAGAALWGMRKAGKLLIRRALLISKITTLAVTGGDDAARAAEKLVELELRKRALVQSARPPTSSAATPIPPHTAPWVLDMNFLERILCLPFSRRKVHDAVLDDIKGILETSLEVRRVDRHIPLSDTLLQRLVAEAYHRAAEGEADGVPRYGKLWKEVDRVADQVELFFKSSREADPAIGAILAYHASKARS